MSWLNSEAPLWLRVMVCVRFGVSAQNRVADWHILGGWGYFPYTPIHESSVQNYNVILLGIIYTFRKPNIQCLEFTGLCKSDLFDKVHQLGRKNCYVEIVSVKIDVGCGRVDKRE